MEEPNHMDFSELFLAYGRKPVVESGKEVMTMPHNAPNLQIISVTKGISNRISVFRNKPTHALVYKHTGASRYAFADNRILLQRGQMLFIPAGESYQVELACEEPSYYTAIQFSGQLPIDTPMRFDVENQAETESAFVRILRCWSIPSRANACQTMALLYGLLAQMMRMLDRAYVPKTKAAAIAPALQYMKEHIFDPELKINQLHLHCGMSDTYFRKLFHCVFQTSPQKYITASRMRQAKQILEEGTCTTVAEAGMLVGYSDPLYFSRVFRQHFAVAPSELLKQDL